MYGFQVDLGLSLQAMKGSLKFRWLLIAVIVLSITFWVILGFISASFENSIPSRNFSDSVQDAEAKGVIEAKVTMRGLKYLNKHECDLVISEAWIESNYNVRYILQLPEWSPLSYIRYRKLSGYKLIIKIQNRGKDTSITTLSRCVNSYYVQASNLTFNLGDHAHYIGLPGDLNTVYFVLDLSRQVTDDFSPYISADGIAIYYDDNAR